MDVPKKEGVVVVEDKGSQPPKREKEKKCTCSFKRFLSVVSPTIGLGIVVTIYVILGASMFETLEYKTEEKTRTVVRQMREEHMRLLSDLTPCEEDWNRVVEQTLLTFQQQIYLIVKTHGWDGHKEDGHRDLKWSFQGAILFCVTVITTIGYGNTVPDTDLGKVATIIYGFFGIPLTLLFLANMGHLLGDSIRAVIRCCTCCVKEKKNLSNPTDLPVSSPIPKPAGLSAIPPDSPTSSPVKDEPNMGEKGTKKTQKQTEVTLDRQETQATSAHDDKVEMSNKGLESVNVPFKVTLLIMLLYFLLGAAMFYYWQKSWSYVDACYFCFISISTIGFGDYVFGSSGLTEDQGKLVACAVYLVLGMSILAMSFDLLKEVVVSIVKKMFFKIAG